MSMKEGWVYLLRERDFLTGTTDRYLKIGLTERDVEDRVKEHQTGNARQVISVYERHVPLMSAMETYLHHVFSTDRINGEWFDMDDDKVNNEVIPLIEALADQQVVAKADKAIEILGWQPQYGDLQSIVQSAWEWHLRHPDGYEG